MASRPREPAPESPRIPSCYRHEPKVPCIPAIVELRYPGGMLPTEGWRCPVCGEELFTADQVELNQQRADALGFYGPKHVTRRKLRQVGSSLSVTLDAELLRELMPGARAGDEVEVGRQGRKIVIWPVRKRDRAVQKKSARSS